MEITKKKVLKNPNISRLDLLRLEMFGTFYCSFTYCQQQNCRNSNDSFTVWHETAWRRKCGILCPLIIFTRLSLYRIFITDENNFIKPGDLSKLCSYNMMIASEFILKNRIYYSRWRAFPVHTQELSTISRLVGNSK